MVSMLTSSAIDRGFEPRQGQTKDYKLVFLASLLSKQHQGENAKTGWLRIRIMCPSGVTRLPADCCFSEQQHYKNPTQGVGLEQSGPHHHFIDLYLFHREESFICDKYDIAHNSGTIPVEQKQHHNKYDIARNTGTIPVEEKQPNDKYDIAQNSGTIPVEQKQPYDK